jgi:hypothetical protein
MKGRVSRVITPYTSETARRFEGICCLHHLGRTEHQARSRRQVELAFCLGYFSTLKMEAMSYSETSNHFRTARRYKPEDRSPHVTLFIVLLKSGFSDIPHHFRFLSFNSKDLTCITSVVCTTENKNKNKKHGV